MYSANGILTRLLAQGTGSIPDGSTIFLFQCIQTELDPLDLLSVRVYQPEREANL